MTAQMPDTCRFDGAEFSIAGVSGTGLYDPINEGFTPVAPHTACWRGFVVTYEVKRELLHKELRIAKLMINLPDLTKDAIDTVPAVQGRRPQWNDDSWGVVWYDLPKEIPLTGGLLLGHGFVSQTYVHMGFHPAWRYERVVELIFDNGRLKSDHDRSKQMAELRKRILAGDQPDPDLVNAEGQEWIARTFELDYSRSGLES